MQETQEMQVQSQGREDPLEQEVVTHSSILAWEIPMDGGAWWATVHGVAKSQIWLSNWACMVEQNESIIPGYLVSPNNSIGFTFSLHNSIYKELDPTV